MRSRLGGIVVLVVAWALAAAQPALADNPLGLSSCGLTQGVARCDGIARTWDGVPLDATVVLPVGHEGNLPLVVEINGFGNSKYEYLDPASTAYTDNAYDWAKDGYAVLTYTARGLWGSCGTPDARLANAADCASGYIHLADARYEARDTQELIGRLVDQGVADPNRIGATGDSYGGGQSFELAALRDRVMLPDGTLEPWRSPNGTPLKLAAAAPVIPWTSLIGAIAPNGRTMATSITPAGAESDPVGVFKLTFANAIFAAAQSATGPGQPTGEPFIPGRPMGFLAPPGVDPQADVAGWVARADLGEPYTDDNAKQIVSMLERFHAAYGIDGSSAPPPLFVGAGFTDDLFPVDETLRFVNRMRRDHPDVPSSLLFGDFGHQRASNKPDVRGQLLSDIHGWFDHYVRGDGPTPADGVTATTQTCPREAPSGGPFHASTFAGLSRGSVNFASAVPQSISFLGGDLTTGIAIDPVTGGGNDCAQVDERDASGVANYRLPAATGAGFTLLGAPRITANLVIHDAAPENAQVAARLWDVYGGKQTLVARGSYRPTGASSDTWEMHANGWHFDAGHVPKLELLAVDAPYGRPSNAAFSVDVRQLSLRLPIREAPPALSPPCRKDLLFAITVPRHLRHARVTVNGRRVAIHGRHARIDLRRQKPGVVRVRTTGRTRAGHRYVKVRRYRVCA